MHGLTGRRARCTGLLGGEELETEARHASILLAIYRADPLTYTDTGYGLIGYTDRAMVSHRM